MTTYYEKSLVLNEQVKELTGATLNEQHKYLMSLSPPLLPGIPPPVPDAAFAKLWRLQLEALDFQVSTPEAYRAAGRLFAPVRSQLCREMKHDKALAFVDWLRNEPDTLETTIDEKLLKRFLQWSKANPKLADAIATQGSKTVTEIVANMG